MVESDVDCEFFRRSAVRGRPPRCSISGDPTGQTALFCHRCEVARIRAGPHCCHLRFGARARTGLIGAGRVEALLRCGLHAVRRGSRQGGPRIRLSDCERCSDYQEAEQRKSQPREAF